MGPYISQLLPNLSAALLKSNGPHLRVSCSEIFSAALSGKSNQCNALHLQINLILCTRHTLFVPSHQYNIYSLYRLCFMFKLPETTCFQQAGWNAYGRLSLFFTFSMTGEFVAFTVIGKKMSSFCSYALQFGRKGK